MQDTTFTLNEREIQVLNGPYLNDGRPTSDAYKFAASLIALLDDMRMFAAKRYLEIYNDTWRQENAPILDEVAFCRKLTSPKIVLYDDLGMACVYFDDAGMFAGHSIEISIDEAKITHVAMVG